VVLTAVFYAHLPGSAKAEPGVEGSIGGPLGGPVPRVCCWSPTDESGRVEESGILASSMTGSGSSSGSSISMSSRGAMGVLPE